MSDPVIRYKIGDRVKVAGYSAEGVITYVDNDDPYVAYKVQFGDRDYDVWVDTEATRLLAGVTLTPEEADRIREALEALGWDRDDLGPLADPETPNKVIKATITLPDDDRVRDALENIEAEAAQWFATIQYED